MKETTISELTAKEYVISDVIRIINPKQIAFYMLNNVELLDLYASRDFNTNEPIVVGLFNKKESYPYYKKWLDRDLG